MGSLPENFPPSPNADIETQARAVLGYLDLDKPAKREAIPEDPLTCPNCSAPASSTKSPYCSERCREIAGFVRQMRSGIAQGWIEQADKQIALGQALWHALGGGRPLRREIAPPRSIAKAMARENRTCQECGAPATTVDHLGSGCNRDINLRAVCEDCCRDRPFGDPKISEQPQFKQNLTDISQRISATEPLRVCNDAETWDWREFLNRRKRGLSSE